MLSLNSKVHSLLSVTSYWDTSLFNKLVCAVSVTGYTEQYVRYTRFFRYSINAR